MSIELRNVTLRVGAEPHIYETSLTLKPGGFNILLGTTLSGKTTLMRLMAGLEKPTTGEIWTNGTNVTGLAVQKRSVAMVYQSFINYPSFSVYENIASPLKVAGLGKQEMDEKVHRFADLLKLTPMLTRLARELSGGMKRRLMIARALVHEPRLLILDEPTAGVDIEIRYSMWNFMRELNAGGTTIILTTHYLEEAESLCNNIAIIDKGVTIEQTDMRSLLNRLNMETFVLYLDRAVDELPDCGDYHVRLLDSSTMEVDMHRGHDLNGIYARLSECDIKVISMKNKSNRLEQLFVHMVESNDPSGATK